MFSQYKKNNKKAKRKILALFASACSIAQVCLAITSEFAFTSIIWERTCPAAIFPVIPRFTICKSEDLKNQQINCFVFETESIKK